MVYILGSFSREMKGRIGLIASILPVFLFFFTQGTYGADSTTTKRSLVLKDPLPKLFYIKVDRSDEELWDAFMLVKKANSGDAVAQHDLGLCYLMGQNFFPDTPKAVYWIKKAADQNLAPARYNYAILLNNGWGVPWNPFEAYRHFQYAAEQGMPQAQYVFGLLHTDNLIVTRNYPEACRWLTQAADSGYSPAKDVLTEFKKLGLDTLRPDPGAGKSGNRKSTSRSDSSQSGFQPVYVNFTVDSIPDPDASTLLREALADWKQNSSGEQARDKKKDQPDSAQFQKILNDAKLSSPEALTILGWWYEKGIIVKRDEVVASVYYLRGIRNDARWAPRLLWKLIQRPSYFPALKRRVDKKDPAAQFAWAELVLSGFDHQLTESQVLHFLEEASDRSFTDATVELGIRLYSGKWLLPDPEKGKLLLEQAAAEGNSEAKIRLWMIALDALPPGSRSPLIDSLNGASDQGSILAKAMLGYCYQKGVGVASNMTQSVYFYREAAQRGNEAAYSALKQLYAALRPDDPDFDLGE